MGTIYDVAAEARVSISTVSRVFQGNEQVGDELKRRVLKAAERLGYQPNSLARALAQGRSNAFGVILPVGLANPYYGTMLERICSSAYRHGFETVVSVPRDWSVEGFLQAAASLERRMIDGLVLFTSARFAEAYRAARTTIRVRGYDTSWWSARSEAWGFPLSPPMRRWAVTRRRGTC